MGSTALHRGACVACSRTFYGRKFQVLVLKTHAITMSDEKINPGLWQLVVFDDQLLSGASIAGFLSVFSQISDLACVVPFEVTGTAGTVVTGRMHEPRIFDLSEFIAGMEGVQQIEWMTLLVSLKGKAALLNRLEGCSLADLGVDDVVVRGVDNSYYYVFSRNKKVCELLLRKYPHGELNGVDPNEAEWPD